MVKLINFGGEIQSRHFLLIFDLRFRKSTLHLFRTGFDPLILLNSRPPLKIWCNKSMTRTA